jgi:hypothetical protein
MLIRLRVMPVNASVSLPKICASQPIHFLQQLPDRDRVMDTGGGNPQPVLSLLRA